MKMDSHLEFLSSNSYLKHLMVYKTRETNVDEINRCRSTYGEFHHLYGDLRVDEKKIPRIYAHVTRDLPIFREVGPAFAEADAKFCEDTSG